MLAYGWVQKRDWFFCGSSMHTGRSLGGRPFTPSIHANERFTYSAFRI